MGNDVCRHPTDFNGLCTDCGQDISNLLTDRPFLLHKGTMIRGSADEARRLEQEIVDELLSSHRLSLIIDLDQTLLHTTIDPQVEQILDTARDAAASIGRIHKITLSSGLDYYVKFRPGVELFLAQVHELFQLHVYTMGNREYADRIVAILDPNATYFGDRVLTRDDNIIVSGDTKSLKRIFSHSDSTVLVLDDRGDVWGWCDNLVLIEPFEFFLSLQQQQKGNDMVNYSYVAEKIKSLRLSELQDDVLLGKIAPLLQTIHSEFFSQENDEADVKKSLRKLKHTVLKGYNICFSSDFVTPNAQNKLGVMVNSFGGEFFTSFPSHLESDRAVNGDKWVLISGGPNSVIAIEARDLDIPLVSFRWLLDSTWRWKAQEPSDYIIDAPGSLSKSTSFTSIDQNILEACNQEIEDELGSEEEEIDEEPGRSSKRLRLDNDVIEDGGELSSTEIDELLEDIESTSSSTSTADDEILDWVT